MFEFFFLGLQNDGIKHLSARQESLKLTETQSVTSWGWNQLQFPEFTKNNKSDVFFENAATCRIDLNTEDN